MPWRHCMHHLKQEPIKQGGGSMSQGYFFGKSTFGLSWALLPRETTHSEMVQKMFLVISWNAQVKYWTWFRVKWNEVPQRTAKLITCLHYQLWSKYVCLTSGNIHPQTLHGTWKWWFPIGISFSKGPFSGSMFVLGGVYLLYNTHHSHQNPSNLLGPLWKPLETYTHRIHGTGIFTYMNGWFLW